MKKIIAALIAVDIVFACVIAFLGVHIHTTEQSLATYLNEAERQSKEAVLVLTRKVMELQE